MQARLTKSRTDRVIDGVCSGLAEYFGIDPLIVRLTFVVLALMNGIGVLLYILLMILLPRSDRTEAVAADAIGQNVQEFGTRAGNTLRRADRGVLAGSVLVILGLAFLLDNLHLFRWLRFDLFWPLLLIVVGVLLLAGQLGGARRMREPETSSSLTVRETPPPAPETRPAGAPDAGSSAGPGTQV